MASTSAVGQLLLTTLSLPAFAGCSDDSTPRSPAVPAAAASAVFNEVLFSPAQDQSQFVELKGIRENGALAGFYLVNENKEKYTIPEDTAALESNAYLLIVFDGQNRADRATLHANRRLFLDTVSGFVELFAPDGRMIDRVAWGPGQAGSVNPGRGGAHGDYIAGTSIGRFPLSIQPRNFLEWITFSDKDVTPGRENPNPRVEVLLPLNGAFFSQPSVNLSWYPVPGATGYKVEIAKDAGFGSVVEESSVKAPDFKTSELETGEYFWRIQAIFEDGSSASFSPVSSFVISATELPTLSQQTSNSFFPTAFAVETIPPLEEGVLPVPMLYQHKDTAMLLLKSKIESGTHAWDKDHGTLDPNDPADNMNCALASTAMVNNYAGGDLSQDRIGYEIRKHFLAGNPTYNLNYGQGLLLDEINTVLSFAFNGANVTRHTPAAADAFWTMVTREIDAGRPIVTRVPGHAIVISGYYRFARTGPDARWVTINDPWSGRYLVNLARMSRVTHYWLVADTSNPRNDEAGIRRDSDGDEMVDFDETERFKTDPNNRDKDRDGVEDKTEVYATVFDPINGYAAGGGGLARDFDLDDIFTELDRDSDGGGCNDGEEDRNANGKRDAGETYNFDEEDDDCEVVLGGRIEMSYGFVPGWPPSCKGAVNIRLKFQLEPEWHDTPEELRTAVPPVYLAKQAVYEISTEGCEDIVGGLFDFWGGANVACNVRGDRRSGLIAFGPESNSDLSFFPLSPQLHLVLPAEALLNLEGQCVYVDGRTSDSPIDHLGGSFLNVGSGEDCETSTRYEYGQPPDLLDFCVEPNVCNSSADSQTLAECYTHPERYAVIPFTGSLSKQGGILQGSDINGNAFPVQVDDAHVRWEICNGCGDEYFE